jgi:hypothetical protein
MDPSEEIEFEREMMSNENLLIEVESLRSTYNKLKKLPLKQAPKEILDCIKEQAVLDQKRNLQSYKLIGWFGKSVAAAATILLLVSAGFYVFDKQPGNSSPSNQTVQLSTAISIQPWVDRNEVIKVSDRVDALKAQTIGEEYEKSYDKLIPVKNTSVPSNRRQGVLLTSSPANQ